MTSDGREVKRMGMNKADLPSKLVMNPFSFVVCYFFSSSSPSLFAVVSVHVYVMAALGIDGIVNFSFVLGVSTILQ